MGKESCAKIVFPAARGRKFFKFDLFASFTALFLPSFDNCVIALRSHKWRRRRRNFKVWLCSKRIFVKQKKREWSPLSSPRLANDSSLFALWSLWLMVDFSRGKTVRKVGRIEWKGYIQQSCAEWTDCKWHYFLFPWVTREISPNHWSLIVTENGGGGGEQRGERGSNEIEENEMKSRVFPVAVQPPFRVETTFQNRWIDSSYSGACGISLSDLWNGAPFCLPMQRRSNF